MATAKISSNVRMEEVLKRTVRIKASLSSSDYILRYFERFGEGIFVMCHDCLSEKGASQKPKT